MSIIAEPLPLHCGAIGSLEHVLLERSQRHHANVDHHPQLVLEPFCDGISNSRKMVFRAVALHAADQLVAVAAADCSDKVISRRTIDCCGNCAYGFGPYVDASQLYHCVGPSSEVRDPPQGASAFTCTRRIHVGEVMGVKAKMTVSRLVEGGDDDLPELAVGQQLSRID